MGEIATTVQSAALFEKLGIIGVLFVCLVVTGLWIKYLAKKHADCVDKQYQQSIEQSKISERTCNILKDLEDKMERNHSELKSNHLEMVSKQNQQTNILTKLEERSNHGKL